MATPTNKKLYAKVKAEAKRNIKFGRLHMLQVG